MSEQDKSDLDDLKALVLELFGEVGGLQATRSAQAHVNRRNTRLFKQLGISDADLIINNEESK